MNWHHQMEAIISQCGFALRAARNTGMALAPRVQAKGELICEPFPNQPLFHW
jgi:hypothetical protein